MAQNTESSFSKPPQILTDGRVIKRSADDAGNTDRSFSKTSADANGDTDEPTADCRTDNADKRRFQKHSLVTQKSGTRGSAVVSTSAVQFFGGSRMRDRHPSSSNADDTSGIQLFCRQLRPARRA